MGSPRRSAVGRDSRVRFESEIREFSGSVMTDESRAEKFPWCYVELHAHLLPGVDDGCVTLDESLRVAEQVAAWGCEALVCTPHMGVARYPENTPRFVAQQVARLQSELDERQIPLHLTASGEFRLTSAAIAWWQEHGVPTLGASRTVLVDTWATTWEPEFDEAIEWLFEAGYRPLLAHPERMRLDIDEWQPLIERLLDRGVRLQGNFKSFGLGDQDAVRVRAWDLLRRDAYHVLAGDLHGLASLAVRVDGLSALALEIEPARLRKLIHERPRSILAGTDLA